MELTQFVAVLAMIGASFVFIYNEIKDLKKQLREEFNDIRVNRKAEIEQSKQDVMNHVNDVKQTLKTDLVTYRVDIKEDIHELRQEVMNLAEKVGRVDGAITHFRRDTNTRNEM